MRRRAVHCGRKRTPPGGDWQRWRSHDGGRCTIDAFTLDKDKPPVCSDYCVFSVEVPQTVGVVYGTIALAGGDAAGLHIGVAPAGLTWLPDVGADAAAALVPLVFRHPSGPVTAVKATIGIKVDAVGNTVQLVNHASCGHIAVVRNVNFPITIVLRAPYSSSNFGLTATWSRQSPITPLSSPMWPKPTDAALTLYWPGTAPPAVAAPPATAAASAAPPAAVTAPPPTSKPPVAASGGAGTALGVPLGSGAAARRIVHCYYDDDSDDDRPPPPPPLAVPAGVAGYGGCGGGGGHYAAAGSYGGGRYASCAGYGGYSHAVVAGYGDGHDAAASEEWTSGVQLTSGIAVVNGPGFNATAGNDDDDGDGGGDAAVPALAAAQDDGCGGGAAAKAADDGGQDEAGAGGGGDYGGDDTDAGGDYYGGDDGGYYDGATSTIATATMTITDGSGGNEPAPAPASTRTCTVHDNA